MSNHTPGPWAVTNRYVFSYRNNGKRSVVCEVDRHAWTVTEEISANARLISAAPELLEALEQLMVRAAKDAEKYAPDGNEPIWAFIADASDAIQKARGEE